MTATVDTIAASETAAELAAAATVVIEAVLPVTELTESLQHFSATTRGKRRQKIPQHL